MKIWNRAKYKREQVTRPRGVFNFSAGSPINPDTSMQVSAYNRGLIYLSTQIAKLPFHVKDAKHNVLTNDRIGKIIDLKPNPEMTSMAFKLLMIQGAITHGNMIAEIEREPLTGRIKYLWPMKHNSWQLERDISTQTLYYRIIGGANDGSGKDAFLDPRDVFHIRNFHTLDGLNGQGVVAYGKDTLGISLGADKFANSLFANGGLPSGVLEVEGKLSDEAKKRIGESWNAAYGNRKTGGTPVLESGVAYKAISHDPQVLQFLESRKFSVLEIARFLGVPPQKLYDSDSQTYNNIEHSNLEVVNDTLDAWAKNWELEVDTKLLGERYGGRYSEMDLFSVYRGDMNTRANYYTKMMQNASITPNEIRTMENKPKYDGGDKYYIASNNFTPVDLQEELIQSQIEKGKKNNQEDPNKVDDAVVNYLRKKAK